MIRRAVTVRRLFTSVLLPGLASGLKACAGGSCRLCQSAFPGFGFALPHDPLQFCVARPFSFLVNDPCIYQLLIEQNLFGHARRVGRQETPF